MTIKNRVFATYTSSISCAGNNNEELFDNISKSRSGIERDNSYFYDAQPAIGKAFTVQNFNRHLIDQCQNILDASTLKNFEDTLLVVGSSVGGMNLTEEIFFRSKNYKEVDPEQHNINSIAHTIKQKFNFYDDISFSTACTSSANAIGYAYEILSKGLYKNVLVVGADALSRTTVGGFLSLGVLSSDPCKPFDAKRDGMNVSEAIACLLLETVPNEQSVEVCGVGYSSDAYHMTHPHPDGDGAQAAMLNALKCAQVETDEIDYINAHGTGTIANDSAEANAINSTFRHKPHTSSTKSITGHTLGAAGALEAIICCMAIEKQTVPPNTFLDNPENSQVNFATSLVKNNIRYAISNSFAFGGNNCSLVFGKVN
ncbi:MAG: beta-ketoacyl-[acyl-carrier-protein] synthase family protein [Campylobacterota bacterium]|nr:beta-ketoacyl-[acyl-carrier-protein] synthase family protein [Campylobacterota bacterium]